MASERCGTACVQIGLEDAVGVVAKDIVEVVVKAAEGMVVGLEAAGEAGNERRSERFVENTYDASPAVSRSFASLNVKCLPRGRSRGHS